MKPVKAKWTTKTGQKIRICDMTDSHLCNTIAMIERNAPKYQAADISAGYSTLSCLQGEMATYCAEQELDRLEETSPEDYIRETHPLYEKLCKERDRRKLTCTPTH